MTLLTTWPDTGPDEVLLATEESEEIRTALDAIGVRFERWPARPLSPSPTADEALAAYADDIARVRDAEGYVHVDAVAMTPRGDPAWADEAAEARGRFLAEHTHADDEDRFFAQGAGVFYLHVGDQVHAVLCTAGDLLSVPARTTHWFDMGTRPDYVAVRFFHDDAGWVADFTGNPIADRFPSFDTLRQRTPSPPAV